MNDAMLDSIRINYHSTVIGGLLAAHLLLHRTGIELENGWPCEGALLNLAKTAAEKLLPG